MSMTAATMTKTTTTTEKGGRTTTMTTTAATTPLVRNLVPALVPVMQSLVPLVPTLVPALVPLVPTLVPPSHPLLPPPPGQPPKSSNSPCASLVPTRPERTGQSAALLNCKPPPPLTQVHQSQLKLSIAVVVIVEVVAVVVVVVKVVVVAVVVRNRLIHRQCQVIPSTAARQTRQGQTVVVGLTNNLRRPHPNRHRCHRRRGCLPCARTHSMQRHKASPCASAGHAAQGDALCRSLVRTGGRHKASPCARGGRHKVWQKS